MSSVREQKIGLAMASLTAFLWGFLAIAMKVATDFVPVNTIVWFRFAFAFVMLALIVGLSRPKRLRILVRPPPLGIVAALALTLNYVGYLTGLDWTTPSNAQVLIQLAPLMLATGGVFVFKERMVRAQIYGVVLALIGFTVFGWDQFESSNVVSNHLLMGNAIIFLGAFAWTVYAMIQKALLMRGHEPQDMNLLLYGVPAITMWPLVDFELLAGLSFGMWMLMVFLGANTLVAYGALGEAFKRLPAYKVALIVTLNPLITIMTMKTLEALEVEWVPEDRVGLLGYASALLVVTGIGVVLVKGGKREDSVDT